MAEPDWIEQDEFEKRRAVFGGKAGGYKFAGTSGTASSNGARGGYKSAEVPVAPASGTGGTVQVTVQGLSGEIAFGPQDVSATITVEELLKRLPLGSEGRRFARKRLLHGNEPMQSSSPLASFCDTRTPDAASTTLTLTVVYDKPLPATSTVVGDLAVWVPEEKKSEDEENEELRDRRRKPAEKTLVGVNCTTGETFHYWSSIGRCTSVSLRLGKGGLYYNSSSHGTATLVYNMYDSAESDDPEEDRETQFAIIPGPHHHGPKDPAGVSGALRFAQRFVKSSGEEIPSVDCASLAVKAWLKVCEDIGISGSYFATLYMPWLEKLGSMNEYELFQWSQSGYPDTIAEIQDTQAREFLERGITPEGAY